MAATNCHNETRKEKTTIFVSLALAGRPPKKHPEIVTTLAKLLRDATAGDPITGVKWTRKTPIKISRELKQRGFRVGPDTVRRLLFGLGDRLRANRKRLTKKQDPKRDQQMRYLVRKRRAFQKAGFPVISIDARPWELIGNFKRPGRTYQQEALDVSESDYPSQAEGVAIPYGIYDLTRNEGDLIIGTSHQTPEFGVAAIRCWWQRHGQHWYGNKRQLLIEADCGGANGNRCWRWKYGLQQLADELGLTITVTHLPTSASKWNPIEHRLFCHVEANWADQPLLDYETVLKFARTTRTENGLRVWAYLNKRLYGTGLKITAEQKASINLKPHRARPRWKYTLAPRTSAHEM